MSGQPSILLNSFVGRERELAQLDAAFADTLAGRGRLILISGEPGIGKTRLADEFSRRALKLGADVAWGRCWEGDGAPAYWPWMQILRALNRGSGEDAPRHPAEMSLLISDTLLQEKQQQTGDPLEARFQLFDGVASKLRDFSGQRPIVLVLDDLHDADQSSLELLKFVARTLPDAQTLMIATYRNAEAQRSTGLAATIAELGREAPQLLLVGLHASEVSEFLHDRAGVTAEEKVVVTITQATAGNPLFLEGVVQMLGAEGKLELLQALQPGDLKLPDSQRVAITARLGRLSRSAQAMLPFAAALGNEFELAPLHTVAAVPDRRLLELLDEVVGAGLMLSVAPNRYRFAHALIRGAIYDEIGSAARITLHQHIAEKLEELYQPNLRGHLPELAHHFTLAAQQGSRRKAIDYSIRAAQAADGALAYEESFRLRQSALNLLSDSERHARHRAQMLSELGRVGGLSGRARSEVTSYFEDTIAIYEALNDREEEARARFNLGMQLVKGEEELNLDVARGRAQLVRAEAMAAALGDRTQLGRIRSALSLAAYQALDPVRGLESADRAMECGLEDFWWCTTSNFRAIHLLHLGRMSEAFTQFADGAKRAQSAHDPLARFRSVSHQGNLRLWSWQPDLALRDLEAAMVELILSRGSLQHRGLSRLSGQAAVMTGDLARARRFLADGPLLVLEGQVALYTGEWERARQVLENGVTAMREAGARAHLCHYLFWLARVELAEGKLNRAERLLREGTELASAASASLFEMFFRPELASVYLQLNRADEAKDNLDRCEEIISFGEAWYGLDGHVARAQGELAASQENWDAAARFLETAVLIFRGQQMPWEEALACEVWSKVAAGQGGRETARARIGAALAIYRDLGAGQPWLDRATRISKKIGVSIHLVEPEPSSSTPLSIQRVNGSSLHRENGNDDLSLARDTALATQPVDTEAVFRKEGEFWTISYDGRTFRLKDAKGLHYIAYLLSRPGEKFRVHDLVAVVEGPPDHPQANSRSLPKLEISGELGDLGPILDDQAKADYRRRRRDLREELDEAESMNDEGRAQRARAEIEVLEQQLSTAIGLGGRDRKTSAHAERARVVVTRNIRAVLGKIEEEHPLLGRHLNAAIKTGYLCTYFPADENTVAWRL